MESFKISNELNRLQGAYPEASLLLEVAKKGGEQSRIAIARLWLSEGIPYAFKEKPALYESIRSWLSSRLDVDAKDLSLSGSARIGQSLAPSKLGNKFGKHSDLDIFIISSSLFDKMKNDFNLWSFNFESGVIKPSNIKEESYWRDNIQRTPKSISKGFIDSNIVPNHRDYPTIQNIAQTMWLLKEKLDITKDAPIVEKASIRCYRDWASYTRQVSINLINE